VLSLQKNTPRKIVGSGSVKVRNEMVDRFNITVQGLLLLFSIV
jgi:hypothetical protein